MSESVKTRKPILTSHQIGVAAALGGLAFVWRALGLGIPLVPPFIIDLCHTITLVAAFAGGPYVVIIVGILIGIATVIPWTDMLGYSLCGVLFCLNVKGIYRLRGWKRHLLLWWWSAMHAYFIAPLYWLAMFDFVLHMIPFKVVLLWVWSTGETTIYWLIRAIPLSILLEVAPTFMEPRWSWRGGELPEPIKPGWTRYDTLGLLISIVVSAVSIIAIVTLLMILP